jgi:oligosaccharide repeat unit polymerase
LSFLVAWVVYLAAPESTLGFIAAATWAVLPIFALPFSLQRGLLGFSHPWTIVFILFVYGWTVRATLAAFDRTQDGARDIMLHGSEPAILVRAILIGGLGMLMMGLGYLIVMARRPSEIDKSLAQPRWTRFDDETSWHRARVEVLSIIVLAGALFGAYMLYRDGVSSGAVIGKRFNNISGGAANRAGTASYLYLRVSYFAHSLYICLLVYRLKFGRSAGPISRLLLPVAGIGATLGPLLSDSRSGVALVLVDTIMLATILRGRVRLGRIGAVASVGLLVLAWMLSLRPGQGGSLSQALSRSVSGRDLFDIGKLAHILQLPPGELHGQTLYGWLLFPFPQDSLPFTKPMWTGLGQYVWQEAYGGVYGNGVPAGLIGELYMNLGVVGVAVGMAAFGCIVAVMYRLILPGLYRGQVLPAILFAIGIVRFTMFGLSNDFGTAVLSSLGDLLPILCLILIMAPPTASRAFGPKSRDAAYGASEVPSRRTAYRQRQSAVAHR